MKLFDPHDHIRVTKNRLPHWQQNGAVYFITFRLGDALPRNLLERWKEERNAWLKWHPLPWSADMEREYHRRFSRRIEEWLDANHGSCILRRHRCAQEIAAAFQHFDGTRINIVSFVVMPNHVHALFAPMHEWPLEKIVHSWKRQSAVRINRLTDSTGVLWQRDYFDRLVRNEQHFARCVRYIRSNPEKAPATWRIHFVRERHRASYRGGGIIPPFLCPPTAARSRLVCRLANRDDMTLPYYSASSSAGCGSRLGSSPLGNRHGRC